MSVHRERRADGGVIYRVRWREAGRGSAQRSRTFDLADDARDFDRRVRRLKQTGDPALLADEVSLRDYVVGEWWPNYAERQLALSTQEAHSIDLDLRILPRLGDIRLTQLRPSVVERFAAELESTCETASASGTSGRFSLPVGEGFATGANYVTVFLLDSNGYTASATVIVRVADETTGVDVRITGVEVVQSVQRYTASGGIAIPRSRGSNSVPYAGVQLAADQWTYVRVFANTTRPARSDGRTPAVTARLRVTGSGGEPQGSPVLPVNGPQDLRVGPPYVEDSERADGARGFLFELPPAVSRRGPLVLSAVINDSTRPIAECRGCAANNELRVTDVRFRPMKTLHIYPLRLIDDFGGVRREPSASGEATAEIFASTRLVMPFRVVVHPWVASVNITSDQMTADREIRRWQAEHPMPGPNERPPRNEDWIIHWVGEHERDHGSADGEVVGVGNGSFAGMASAPTLFCCNPPRIERFALVEQNRPLTSVAHEYGHIRGLPHADHGPQPPSCGGGLRGETGDDEFPDAMGTLVGFGFHPTRRAVLPAYDPSPPRRARNFDFMSYCAGDGNAWISTRYWDRLIDDNNDGPAPRALRRAAAQAGPRGPALAVSVRLDSNGSDGVVTSVQPLASGAQASVGGSPYELVVLRTDGTALPTTRVAAAEVHGDRPNPTIGLHVNATVPAGPAAAAVQLRSQGRLLAARQASAHAPVVKLRAPRAGIRVGRSGSLRVRWNARDADGDRLRFSIDQATGPNARFRLVAGGFTGSSATVPASVLRPSRRARIRIRAFDGFRESHDIVAPIRIPPRPPAVSITTPGGRRTVRADAALALEGQAFDAFNRTVASRALTWRVDGRMIGRGRTVAASNLAPGRRTITLTARDRAGQHASARMSVRVTRVTPRLITLRAPRRVSRGARALTLRLAASVPARVRVSGSRTRGAGRVGRRTRALRVRLAPGKAPLALTLRLSGGGGGGDAAPSG